MQHHSITYKKHQKKGINLLTLYDAAVHVHFQCQFRNISHPFIYCFTYRADYKICLHGVQFHK